MPDLVAETEALQEPWCLGILRRLLLCAGVWYRSDRYRRILLLADSCAVISMGPDLCSRILYGPGPPVPFRGVDLRRSILCTLYRGSLRYGGSLRGLYRLGLRP